MAHKGGAVSGLWIGAQLGAKTGLALSIMYALPVVALWLGEPLAALGILYFAFLVGVAPATLIGTLTGAALGALLGRLQPHTTPATAQGLGVVAGILTAGLVHVGYFSLRVMEANGAVMWFFCIGLPTPMFIVAAAWASGQVAHLLINPTAAMRFPFWLFRWQLSDKVLIVMALGMLGVGLAGIKFFGLNLAPDSVFPLVVVAFVNSVLLLVLYLRQVTQVSSQSPLA